MKVPAARLLAVALVSAVAAGCGPDAAGPPSPPPTPAPPPTAFDPAHAGRIAGRVTWPGDVPRPPGFLIAAPRPDGTFDSKVVPNPYTPGVDPKTRGVANAVVMLRAVRPGAAKPWDHPPARVEMADYDLRIRQGDGPPRRVGFVRRGDAVEMVATEAAFHTLRARGAAFFALAFPDANKLRRRTFDTPGRVDLSSGARYYWAAGTLVVSDHPYLTLTDAEGKFTLDGVPAGPVEVVAWLPNWDLAGQARDPESGMVYRVTYAPPREQSAAAAVDAGRTTTRDFTLR